MPGPPLKKILFIVQLPPPVHGVSMMNSQLIDSPMLRKRYHPEVINFQFVKSLKNISRFSFGKMLLAGQYFFQIGQTVKRDRPELVYFTLCPTGVAFFRDAAYVFLLKLTGVRLILHLHGKGIKAVTANSRWKRALYRLVFRRTHIVCLSERLKEDIRPVYTPAPFVVANGIIPLTEAKIPSLNGSSRSRPRLLYLSNFFSSKGILILLDALSRLKNDGIDFEAHLAGAPGDLSLEELAERIEELDLGGAVQLIGPVYGTDKYRTFQNADIFVHPTCNDAFPLVILEAMQCALPVVSTFEGGIPDIVRHRETGLLVEKENVTMLADNLKLLLKDEAWRKTLGRNGQQRFEENYTSCLFQKNMLEVFQRILEENKN